MSISRYTRRIRRYAGYIAGAFALASRVRGTGSPGGLTFPGTGSPAGASPGQLTPSGSVSPLSGGLAPSGRFRSPSRASTLVGGESATDASGSIRSGGQWSNLAAIATAAYLLRQAGQNVPAVPPAIAPLPAVTPGVTPEDPAIAVAVAAERERLKRLRGRASTILTGPMGLQGQPPLLRPTLMGA